MFYNIRVFFAEYVLAKAIQCNSVYLILHGGLFHRLVERLTGMLYCKLTNPKYAVGKKGELNEQC